MRYYPTVAEAVESLPPGGYEADLSREQMVYCGGLADPDDGKGGCFRISATGPADGVDVIELLANDLSTGGGVFLRRVSNFWGGAACGFSANVVTPIVTAGVPVATGTTLVQVGTSDSFTFASNTFTYNRQIGGRFRVTQSHQVSVVVAATRTISMRTLVNGSVTADSDTLATNQIYTSASNWQTWSTFDEVVLSFGDTVGFADVNLGGTENITRYAGSCIIERIGPE